MPIPLFVRQIQQFVCFEKESTYRRYCFHTPLVSPAQGSIDKRIKRKGAGRNAETFGIQQREGNDNYVGQVQVLKGMNNENFKAKYM